MAHRSAILARPDAWREEFLLSSPYHAPSRAPGVRLSEEETAFLQQRLADLRTEHRDLDDVIARLADAGPADLLQIQRLKKRKLRLKDEIAQVESRLLPDIIA